MSIFERAKNALRANLSALASPGDDPAALIDATLREMQGALSQGQKELVTTLGTAKRLEAEAEALSALIRANGPAAVRLAKRAIEGGRALPIDEALKLEWECYRGTLETDDRVEALRAFAEKRKPVFRGR